MSVFNKECGVYMSIKVVDKGFGNVLNIPDDARGNVLITIEGDNNVITIVNLRRVDNLKITVDGDGGMIQMDPFRIGNLSIGIKHGAKVVIGKGTSIEGAYILSDHGRVVSIGDDCMFSYNVQIRTTDSHGIYDVLNS